MRLVHVAVGVVRNARGQILIARRASHQHQGGLWEFPGGKIELGEAPRAALERELNEEVGIEVVASHPLTRVEHHYADKSVLLDVHCVTDFRGEAFGREGQPLRWVSPAELSSYPLPEANKPILHAINLPSCMAITGDGVPLPAFAEKLDRASVAGAGIVQVRLKSLPVERWGAYWNMITSYPNLQCTVNSSVGKERWAEVPGLHLTSADLISQARRPISASVLLGASCHTADEVEHARRVAVDYIAISPVGATATHPHAEPLGWHGFADLVRLAHCPVYALGGLTASDLKRSWEVGGHGIAAISHFWH